MTTRPIRTCVGCRVAKEKRLLIRLARRADGSVVVDVGGRQAGRGAYVCPDAECVERALQRGRLSHAFRKPCDVRHDLATEIREASRGGNVDLRRAASDQGIVRDAGRVT